MWVLVRVWERDVLLLGDRRQGYIIRFWQTSRLILSEKVNVMVHLCHTFIRKKWIKTEKWVDTSNNLIRPLLPFLRGIRFLCFRLNFKKKYDDDGLSVTSLLRQGYLKIKIPSTTHKKFWKRQQEIFIITKEIQNSTNLCI